MCDYYVITYFIPTIKARDENLWDVIDDVVNMRADSVTRAVTVTDQHALIMLDLKHMVGSIPRRCRPVLMGHALEKPFFNPNRYVRPQASRPDPI